MTIQIANSNHTQCSICVLQCLQTLRGTCKSALLLLQPFYPTATAAVQRVCIAADTAQRGSCSTVLCAILHCLICRWQCLTYCRRGPRERLAYLTCISLRLPRPHSQLSRAQFEICSTRTSCWEGSPLLEQCGKRCFAAQPPELIVYHCWRWPHLASLTLTFLVKLSQHVVYLMQGLLLTARNSIGIRS